MDRLELYYGAPHHTQPLGDYIRIRNVYVRSTRSYRRLAGESAKGLQRDTRAKCRELDLVDKLRRLRAYDNGGGQATKAPYEAVGSRAFYRGSREQAAAASAGAVATVASSVASSEVFGGGAADLHRQKKTRHLRLLRCAVRISPALARSRSPSTPLTLGYPLHCACHSGASYKSNEGGCATRVLHTPGPIRTPGPTRTLGAAGRLCVPLTIPVGTPRVSGGYCRGSPRWCWPSSCSAS